MAVKRIKSPVEKPEIPAGEFVKYRAAISFNIGKIGPYENLQITKGDEIEYNGDAIKYRGNIHQTSQAFKGAVVRGWISKDGASSSRSDSSAKVNVTPADPRKDQKFSSKVEPQEETVVVGDYKSIRSISTPKMEMEKDSSDSGDVVAKISNPVSSSTKITANTDYAKRIQEIESARPEITKVSSKKENTDSETESNDLPPAKSETTLIEPKGISKKEKKEAKKAPKKANTDKKAAADLAEKKKAERLKSLESSSPLKEETKTEE